MWWGKFIGALLGLLMTKGPLGLLLGLWLGHQFDRGIKLNRFYRWQRPFQDITKIKECFFEATFSVMGHVSKAQGIVSQHEIKLARQVMQQMCLNQEQIKQAIMHFNAGKSQQFNLQQALENLMRACHHQRALLQTFVEIQFQAAQGGGMVDPAQKAVLQTICEYLGFTPLKPWDENEQFYQQSYHHRGASEQSSHQDLLNSYHILGVKKNDSAGDIKKAYRRLINQHHPDKLIAQGLPEAMIKVANDKTQQIKKAYEVIRSHQGF